MFFFSTTSRAKSRYAAYLSGEMPIEQGMISGKEIDYDVIALIADFSPEIASLNAHSAICAKKISREQRRIKTITMRLLQAVAYGMESREVNIPLNSWDTGGQFKSHLFAKDLLQKSPEFLLERGDITDWGGRSFKNITAFEYALWAKDFKMMQMMVSCIPFTIEGYHIKQALLRQYEQVIAPTYAGGGLTYTHTYERPKLDSAGIPTKDATGNWDCEVVTEQYTENHFDLGPLLEAYVDYDRQFFTRTSQQLTACWIKLIGTFQRLLPIHILQRYCDPHLPFDRDLFCHFNKTFTRCVNFYHDYANKVSLAFTTHDDYYLYTHTHRRIGTTFTSKISNYFAIFRVAHRSAGALICQYGPKEGLGRFIWKIDSEALSHLDAVSTYEIKVQMASIFQRTSPLGAIEHAKRY